jgi:short-chain fatty acids transporter
LVVLLPVLFWMLAPKREQDMVPYAMAQAPARRQPEPVAPLATQSTIEARDGIDLSDFSIPDRLDRSAIVAWILAILLLAAFFMYVRDSGPLRIRIDDVNALMFALGLILHGSPRGYMSAVEDAARDCGGIIIQFPIYAGIMAMMKASGIIDTLTDAFTRIGTAQTLPVMSFLAATLVGLFVPSGGAQWSLQGPIALQSGAAVGAEPGPMLMSVAYGDELANMLQPFWALVLLSVTRARARDILGYTMALMVLVMPVYLIFFWL